MKIHILILMTLLATACQSPKISADLLVTDATVYTVDEDFTTVEAFAVKDGRILETGKSAALRRKYDPGQSLSLEGKYVYPGWIDAHCHFFGYGMTLNQVNVAGTSSVEEIIARVKAHHAKHPGHWITGRGWDQNDWEEKAFPDKEMLDAHFPDNPVLLRRIDGHAAWANSKALELAGITAQTRVEGGSIEVVQGEVTGILIDNAIGLVGSKAPEATEEEMRNALSEAESMCFSVGLTSVQDAGLGKDVVEMIRQQHESAKLKIRINAWLSPSQENFSHFVEQGAWQSERMSINTIKLFADGALGSRGALMMEDYSDDPGNKGLLVNDMNELGDLCLRAYEKGFAVATHCIGDDANRKMLKLYAAVLSGPNDRRWRIEHAQIIHPDDFKYFGGYDIIPSVQTTHATSDMYWAEDRVGPERMKGAYAYRKLLDENGWLPNGSDFPVEHINPLYGFYAAVARKDQQGWPEGGFQKDQALSREEALRAMTIWAARAAFEEELKGSLEAGKLADFVVTDTDLMSAPEEELFSIPVQATWSGGELVYERHTEE